jgi:hypothetical protein
MTWYYEILDQNEKVLEASEAAYASDTHMKEKPVLFGSIPTKGWKDEGGGLLTRLSSGPKINAKQKD